MNEEKVDRVLKNILIVILSVTVILCIINIVSSCNKPNTLDINKMVPHNTQNNR